MSSSTVLALLLVDGYNLIGAWTKLQHLKAKQGLEVARRKLTESLVNYSACQDYHIRIVFDSQYREMPRQEEEITPQVLVYYTDFGQTADTYIEKTCADFRQDIRKFRQRLIVATSDRVQQQVVTGFGAEWMSAHRLAADIEATLHRAKQYQKSRSPNRRLANQLSPAVVHQMSNLRLGKRQVPHG